jgi:hypothetical protein
MTSTIHFQVNGFSRSKIEIIHFGSASVDVEDLKTRKARQLSFKKSALFAKLALILEFSDKPSDILNIKHYFFTVHEN